MADLGIRHIFQVFSHQVWLESDIQFKKYLPHKKGDTHTHTVWSDSFPPYD